MQSGAGICPYCNIRKIHSAPNINKKITCGAYECRKAHQIWIRRHPCPYCGKACNGQKTRPCENGMCITKHDLLLRSNKRKKNQRWRLSSRGKELTLARSRRPEVAAQRRHSRAARRSMLRLGGYSMHSVIAKWDARWRANKLAKCYWCQKITATKKCHTDHILALSNGGSHVIENLCIACHSCNLSKSAKSLAKWNSLISNPTLI